MKISAKTKEYSLYVKAKTTGREKIDEKVLDRFTRAYLRCFLKPKQVKSSSVEFIGPIGISLKDRLKKEITKRDFLFIVEYIIVAVQKLHGNNLPLGNLSMDLQYIFINETTKELQFLYMPLVSAQEPGNLIELFDSVIYLARPAEEKDTDYISRFNYFIKSIKPFDINAVEQFVQHEDRSVVNTVRKHNAGQSGFMTSNHQRYYDHMENQKKMQQEEEMRQAAKPVTPSPHISDEEATALLIENRWSENNSSGFKNTVNPQVEYVQPARSNTGFGAGSSFAGFTDSERAFSGSEDATGLLTDFEETAGSYRTRQENTDCFAEFGETASPATGFVQTTGFENGFAGAAGHFADAEEATGLLIENPGVSGCFENTNPVGEYDEEATSLLTEDCVSAKKYAEPAVVYPVLYRSQTGETIQVNKPVFRIGKERSYVDYFVTNNSAVSRSHADIITRENGYFIIDLNSKNRTYVNNQPIAAQTETCIKDGDMLRLANEEFVFKVSNGQAAAQSPRCPACNASIKPGAKFCVMCGRKV